MEPELTQKIILSIVENIGLGAIVGFGAFILNIVLEKYKTSQSMREEVAKLRINKISDIWESFDSLYVKLAGLYLRSGDIKRADKYEYEKLDSISEKCKVLLRDEIEKPILEIINTEIPSIENKIMSYRFWIGKKLTEVLVDQKVALERFAKYNHEEIFREDLNLKFSDLNSLVSYIEVTRKDITDMLKYL